LPCVFLCWLGEVKGGRDKSGLGLYPALQIYVIVLFESIFLKVICPILGPQKAQSLPSPLLPFCYIKLKSMYFSLSNPDIELAK
jgi:hypothetical protein